MGDYNDDELLVKDESVEPGDSEWGHTDKMTGVITEPASTFEKTAQFPPRTVDWLVPTLILLVVVILSNFLMMSNPEIAYELKDKQRAQMEKGFDDAVAKGQISREDADRRIEDQMEMFGGTTGMIVSSASILIGGFIFFFILTGIYFLFSKFALKGNGTYTSALVANGLVAYIGMIHVIITVIAALLLGRYMQDISVATLMNIEKSTMMGFFLGKLDVISIWSYTVVGIGLAKMFRSESTGKYIAMVFAVWIIGSFLFYLLGKAVPMFSGLAG